MRNQFLIILSFILFLTTSLNAEAQVSRGLSASFSQDTIMIGDQPTLTIKVTKDVSERVAFPEFDTKMTEEFELISQGGIDTTRTEGSRAMELVRKYVFTVFDAGDYTIDGLGVIFVNADKVDTVFTNKLHLVVNTYAIDTTTQTIYDIKEPIETPLRFYEISNYVYWGLLILALLAGVIYLFIRYRRKESFFSRPKLPPHVIAVGELKKIAEMNLWQKGKHKEYYTMLTDTVRVYLEARFGASAMEMTTDEIMAAISDDNINKSDENMLYELLSTADLVKFAKFIPNNSDNEEAMKSAFSFVENTKREEEIVEEEVVEATETTEDNDTKQDEGKEDDK